HLLLGRLRGVVAGDDVERTVLEPADERLDVLVGPQRRVRLEVAVEALQSTIGQQQVLWTNRPCDAYALVLAAADQFHAAGARDVQDVQAALRHLGQLDVAVNDDLFGTGRHAAQAEPHALRALVHDAAAGQVRVLRVAEHGLVEHAAV